MTGIASVRSWVMVICSLIPRAYLHSHFLAKIRANCEQSVPEYRTARDERPRGSENRPCAQLRLLGMGSAGLCKEGNARKTLRRGDESCGAAPLGSYGRFYTNLCAIPISGCDICQDACPFNRAHGGSTRAVGPA